MNEYEGVITSLNLYEHSQKNNWEMGVRFSKEDDSELYDGALKEVKKIIAFIANSSEKSSVSSTYNRDYRTSGGDKYQKSKMSPILKNTPKKGFLEKALDSVLGETGYCIRCGEYIDYNLEKPYCPEHFKSWAKYKNENYQEKYCHMCGEKAKTSKKRPVCYDCFQKFKK